MSCTKTALCGLLRHSEWNRLFKLFKPNWYHLQDSKPSSGLWQGLFIRATLIQHRLIFGVSITRPGPNCLPGVCNHCYQLAGMWRRAQIRKSQPDVSRHDTPRAWCQVFRTKKIGQKWHSEWVNNKRVGTVVRMSESFKSFTLLHRIPA